MSFLKGRVDRLEQKEGAHGRCPGCGGRPGDIRVIVFGTGEPPPEPRWCPKDLCPVCGLLLPPIRIIDFPDENEAGRAHPAADAAAES